MRSGISARGIRLLESGHRAAPRLETVRLLSLGLDLNDDQRQSLLHAARPDLARKSSSTVPTPNEPPMGRPKGNIPALSMHSLAGRKSSRTSLDG